MSNLVSLLTGSVVRHLMSMTAGILIGIGWLASADKISFIKISTGIVVGLVAQIWSGAQKKRFAETTQITIINPEADQHFNPNPDIRRE